MPPRNTTSVETIETHIDSFDIDTAKHPRDGLYGTTTYMNDAPEIAMEFGSPGAPALFDARSIIVTKPLDVILVTEPNATLRANTTAGDPIATANGALDAIVAQERETRVDLLALLKDGGQVGPASVPATGTDPVALAEGTGLVSGDPEPTLEAAEGTRVGALPESANAQWTRDALGAGARVTEVATAQQLADELAARVRAIDAARKLTDLDAQARAVADAIPSDIMVTTAAPGFGGSTVEFDTGNGTVPVPAEALVDALNLLGVGLVQDARGYAADPWLFSPASGIVTGSALGPLRTSGEYGAHAATHAFALPDGSPRRLGNLTFAPPYRAPQSFDQPVYGAWTPTRAEASLADITSSAGSAAGVLAASPDPTSGPAAQHALDSALDAIVSRYADELAIAGGTLADAQAANATSLQADAVAARARALAQGSLAPRAVALPAGTPAVGSFTLGARREEDVALGTFVVPVVVETRGHADVIGSDVHALEWATPCAKARKPGASRWP